MSFWRACGHRHAVNVDLVWGVKVGYGSITDVHPPWLTARFRQQRASGHQFLVPTELLTLPAAIASAYRPATRQSFKSWPMVSGAWSEKRWSR